MKTTKEKNFGTNTTTDLSRKAEKVDVNRFVRFLDSCKYWQGVSECNCFSPLPTGGCLRCDMDEAVELLTQIIEPVIPLCGGG
jgi:hypothetical protein